MSWPGLLEAQPCRPLLFLRFWWVKQDFRPAAAPPFSPTSSYQGSNPDEVHPFTLNLDLQTISEPAWLQKEGADAFHAAPSVLQNHLWLHQALWKSESDRRVCLEVVWWAGFQRTFRHRSYLRCRRLGQVGAYETLWLFVATCVCFQQLLKWLWRDVEERKNPSAVCSESPENGNSLYLKYKTFLSDVLTWKIHLEHDMST